MNPERSIIIAGIQRSGTSFLCDALQKLGNVGLPAEHFVKMVEPQWIENKEIELKPLSKKVVQQMGYSV